MSFEEIKIESFEAGLITDPAATDIPPGAATLAENVDLTSAGKLKKSRGIKSFGLPALPAGLLLEAFHEFRITIPESKDIMVIFGTNAGRDRFYISPWYDDITQTWNTSTWLELTEGLVTTIAVKNSDTSFELSPASGLSTVDDYHNKWYVVFFDTSAPTVPLAENYVLDYVAASRRIIVRYANTDPGVGDHVLLVRFPVFKHNGLTLVPHYRIDGLPTFTQHGEHLYIYTGSHKIDDGPDLWLGFIGTATARQGYLNDDSLDFRGFHFEHAQVFDASQFQLFSSDIFNETENPLPYTDAGDRWFFLATWLLDGFQESTIYFDETTVFNNVVAIPDNTSKIRVSFGFFLSTYLRSDYWPAVRATDYMKVLSRRVRKLLLYVARGKAGTPNARPTTPFFMWKEVDIDDSSWIDLLSLGLYISSSTLSGVEWDFAQKFPFELNTGHAIEKTGANARQGLQVGGNYVVGPIFADQEYKDTLVIAPLSGTLVGKNLMPNVLPLSLWVRCREQGINEIITMAELAGRLLVFGSNTMAVVELIESTILTGRIVEQYQKRGIISDRGVQVIDAVAYYCGRESIYAFDGSQVTDIGDRIKNDWNAIPLADRQTCFTGFNRRLKQFFIKAGSTLFVYSTLQDNWKTETLDRPWTYFASGVDGEFLGTDGTGIFEIDAANYTTARGFKWRSKHLDSSRIKPRRFRASYKSADLITVDIYDMESGSLLPIETLHLLPEGSERHVNIPISFESTRIMINLQAAASVNDNIEIDHIALAGTARAQR